MFKILNEYNLITIENSKYDYRKFCLYYSNHCRQPGGKSFSSHFSIKPNTNYGWKMMKISEQ